MTAPKELEKYRRYIEQMFDEGSDALISNSCAAHAGIVIETLLTRAKTEVNLLCRDLDNLIYDELSMIGCFIDTISRGVSIRILIQNNPKADLLIQHLSKRIPDENKKFVQLRVCGSAARHKSEGFNFIVSDKRAFRFEDDLDNHVAKASANSPELAIKLTRFFDQLWNENNTSIA